MPIIELPRLESPLDQGDLLEGIRLFHTGKLDISTGGESLTFKDEVCMVISRSYVTAHKATLLVVAVQAEKSKTPAEVNSFERGLAYLTNWRDGLESPDLFYLGHLPGREDRGRYNARLDRVYTIEVPTKPELRQKFVATHRIAGRHADFRRDLHARIFRAFANMGFEDFAWFSDTDLRFLNQLGTTEIRAMRVEQDRIRAKDQADGTVSKELQTLDNRIVDLEKRMKPYADEQLRRNPSPSSDPPG